jgi:hypothetical protein
LLISPRAGGSSLDAATLDAATLGAALDYPGDWRHSTTAPDEPWNITVVVPDENAQGGSYLTLQSTEARVELNVTGPGVARVWIKPRGSYRRSTQRAELAVVGGESTVITVTGDFRDPPSRPWQQAEVAVPAGSHTLVLRTLVPIGSPWSYADFDGFGYTPAAILLTVPLSLEAQLGQPFSITASASSAATFSASGLPDGLGIDPVTGTISGTPTAAGVSTATITATAASGADSESVTITVAQPLGGGTDQPTWTWRTPATTSQAWRVVSDSGFPPKTADGIDAIECLNFAAEDSWVETEVAGPGWVSWKQRAELGSYGASSTIAVVVDGVPVGPPLQPPHEFWSERNVWIPAGRHTVRWTARLKPGSTANPGTADGPARLDQITFTPDTGNIPEMGPLTYAEWAAPLPAGSRGTDDDGDGNGVSNWTEYSFGPPAGLSWPPAATLAKEDTWYVFAVTSNAAAAEGVWSFECLHPAIPGYPAGWSAASVWDRSFTRHNGRWEARVARLPRLAYSSTLPTGSYIQEPSPLLVVGRFICRNGPAAP